MEENTVSGDHVEMVATCELYNLNKSKKPCHRIFNGHYSNTYTLK